MAGDRPDQSPATTTSTTGRPVPDYYRNLNLPDLVSSIQDAESIGRGKGEASPAALTARVRNNSFLFDFGRDEAWTLFSPQATQVAALLKKSKPEDLKCRWINIWKPFEMRDVIETIAKHYDFTPRLKAVMISEPNRRTYAGQSPNYGHEHSNRLGRIKRSFDRPSRPPAADVVELDERRTVVTQGDGLNHYKIVDSLWHFHSYDVGKKYVCIGYNAIHYVKSSHSEEEEALPGKKILPPGRRLWCWLIYCHDDTVISIHEDPNYQGNTVNFQDESSSSARQDIHFSHFVDVFRQLSNPEREVNEQNSLKILPLRIRKDASSETMKTWPSLLFYYLFDDWFTGYSLASRENTQYGARLDRLRSQMLMKPDLKHIKTLHRIGRQLAILKKVYESYNLLIDRLLVRQPRSKSLEPSQEYGTPKLGPDLHSGALVRLERMRDRVTLYALGEIIDCSNEKDSLGTMTFNLLALKESQAVERLTRTTIFLAKVTILFLPVTLMTGYFSVQISDLQGVYSAKTYWACFGVVMGLSILSIVAFSMITGTVEGGSTFRTITRISMDKIKTLTKSRAYDDDDDYDLRKHV